MSDEQLLKQWQDGDKTAGASLIRKYRGPLAGFFANRVPATDAGDLVQETLLALMESRSRIHSGNSFRAFVFGIARRKLLERGRKRTTRSLGEDLEARLMAEAPPLTQLVAGKSENNIVIAGFRSLSVDDQLLLRLSGFERLKQRELAEVFDVPLSVIGGRLHRARGRLQRAVERLKENPADVESTETSLQTYWRSLAAPPLSD